MFKSKYLWGIIALAAILRLVGLTHTPVGFTPDEASFGYDAYSILQTGQDQWGNWLPLTLKSFGDYKMPLYSYLAMPSIAAFGLNVFATRLPNAIFGILAVFATYLFTKKIFKDLPAQAGEKLALISSLFLAISPWHIAMSRGAFEANLTTFFLTISLYFLLRARDNSKYYLYSFIFAGLNLFTYHTARIATLPVLFLAFTLLFNNHRKHILLAKKYLLVLLAFTFLAGFSLLSGGSERLTTSNIFSLSGNVFRERVNYIYAGMPEILAKFTHNKVNYVSNIFITKYLDYFSPQFLFTQGAREATYGMIPGVGVLYLFEIFTIFASFLLLVKRFNKKYLFLISWILISVFPASLSLGPGLAANRVAFMMPALQIFSAIGLLEVYKFLQGYFSKKLVAYSLVAIISLSSFKFIDLQWFVQPVNGADAMFVSVEESINYISEIEDQYDIIIIDKRLSEAHIFLAFFKQTNPEVFQQESKNWQFEMGGYSWVDQLPEYNLNKYVIRSIDWQRDLRVKNALILFKAGRLPDIATPIKTFEKPDGKPAYYLIDTRVNVFAKI